MFTIRVKNGQREEVFEANEVSLIESPLQQMGGPIQTCDDRILIATGVGMTKASRDIGCGEVFVMNGEGRTVARYRLGDEVTPGCYRDLRNGNGGWEDRTFTGQAGLKVA